MPPQCIGGPSMLGAAANPLEAIAPQESAGEVTMTDPLRAVLYARVSDSHGSELQLMMGRDYAALNGWTVVGEFVDVQVSDSKADRPAYRNMLETVRAGRADIVVAYDMSRIVRNLDEAGELIRNRIRLGLIA